MNNDIRKRITAVAMAGAIASTGAMQEKNKDIDPLLENHFNHQKEQIEYYNYVENEDLSNYDGMFVNFYRDGIIIINNKKYKVGDLYLESGINNGKEETFLVFYKMPNIDILTGEEKINFRRTDVMLFSNSYCFYEIYSMYKELITNNTINIIDSNKTIIVDMIKKFDGTMHVETPETSFGKVKH